jgi:hypothetical protein
MHFEFLVEDQSCKAAMEILLPKLINEEDTFNMRDKLNAISPQR